MTSVLFRFINTTNEEYPQDIFIHLLNLSGLPTKLAKLKEKFKLGFFCASSCHIALTLTAADWQGCYGVEANWRNSAASFGPMPSSSCLKNTYV